MTLKRENEETERIVLRILFKIADYARKFPSGRWSFLGPGCGKKWYGTHVNKPDGEWDKTAEGIMLNFAESGHPVFRASSALEKKRRI